MARLVDPTTGRSFVPGSSCLVGRTTASQFVLAQPWVSGQHATLRWTGEHWSVRDLGSKNGTFVRGKRLEPGRWTELTAGDPLGFGRLEDPWVLEDASAPAAMAWQGERAVVADEGLLALPTPEDPVVCVHLGEAGWVAETPDGVRAVQHGERLEIGGATWVLDLPHVVAATRDHRAARLADARLQLRVSRDLEHVDAALHTAAGVVLLPYRAHHELLLHLAQARLADAATPGLPPDEHGWRYPDDVAQDLRIPGAHFNMTIYRARQQVRGLGFEDPDALIERRRGSGQIRLGLAQVRVARA